MKTFCANDQQRFSRLSGDLNPVHLDPQAGRYSPWGKVVVHGIAQLLWLLDEWCAGRSGDICLVALKVRFIKGLGLGEAVSLRIDADEPPVATLSLVNDQGAPVLKCRLHYRPCQANTATALPTAAADHNAVMPRAIDETDVIGSREQLGLSIDPALLALLYPRLAVSCDRQQLAFLLNTTKYVGNVWPGARSIYQGLEADFADAPGGAEAVEYEIVRVDPKLSLTHVDIRCAFATGKLTAFFRPAPVPQASLEEMATLVTPGQFGGRRALVIGGTQGIGAAIWKLLAAGGAEVLLTYNSSEKLASEAATEARARGLSVNCMQLDVCAPGDAAMSALREFEPTHVYYLATPFIFRGSADYFSSALFAEFNAVYIEGFYRIFQALAASAGYFLVPSSTALDSNVPDMMEYTMSKLAMEGMARALAARHAGVRVACPRLPRIRTEQTNSLIKVDEKSATEVALGILG